jgi:cytochrome b561/polyisoprenoid-binding protein YceI
MSMPPDRYSRTAIALHWAIAAGLVFQLALGWRLGDLRQGPEQFWLYQFHKSVGISILVLSLARLAIRLVTPRPAAEGDGIWPRRLAGAVHAGFYGVMIGAPLTGWLLVSTASVRVPTIIFDLLPWPHVPIAGSLEGAARKQVHEAAEEAHEIFAYIGIALFVLHVAGALRHQWLLRQPLLERMLPFATRRSRVLPMLAAVTLLLIGAWALGRSAQPPAEPAPAPTASEAVASAPAAPPSKPAPVEEVPALNATEAVPVSEEPVATPEWSVDSGGKLGFTARWNGQAVEGQFSRWQADIAFDQAALDRSLIKVTIDLASAGTGDSQRDESLKGPEFFDSVTHPAARFVSDRIKSLGGDRYEADGRLTLRGISHRVKLAFTVAIRDGTARVKGGTSIDRTAFGIGTGQWATTDAIAGDVAVDFDFSARRD